MQFGRRWLSVTLAGAVLLSPAVVASYQFLASPPVAKAADKEERHPRLHAALKELREARKELKDADHDFGGHREKAIESIDHSIKQIEESLAWAKEHDK